MQGSRIFESTDFNSDGLADGIHFGILGMEVENTPPASGTFFANQFIGVQAFLNQHSIADWSQYCLSYRFTSRDFDDGVVGLAYVAAQPGVNAAGVYVWVCVCVWVGVCVWGCGGVCVGVGVCVWVGVCVRVCGCGGRYTYMYVYQSIKSRILYLLK